MTSEALLTVRRITDLVADSPRPLDSFGPEMMEYSLLLRNALHAVRSGFTRQRDLHDPTVRSAGAAISPWHAAASIDDRTRTAAFIRGCVRAVESVLSTHRDRPLHLLEAGCGPLGALAVPLLSRFGPEELQVTLVDLHQESIDSAQLLLASLGLSNHIRQGVCADILETSLSVEPHITLSETMYTALSVEPQVQIARSLVRQYPQALLLPQSIEVHLSLIDWAAEQQAAPPQAQNRIEVGLVFELNTHTARELPESEGRLPAACLQLPPIPPGYAPFLTTRVDVFHGAAFADYDAEITAPVPLWFANTPLQEGDKLQFAYRLGDAPGLECTLPGRLSN